MAGDEGLIEGLIRRHIQVQRFGGSQVKKSLPVIRQLARDVRARVEAGGLTEFQAGRAAQIEADIRLLATRSMGDLQGALELEDFAVREADFTQRIMQSAVTVDLGAGVNADQLRALVSQRQMSFTTGGTVQRLTIRQAFEQLSDTVGRDAMRVFQAGTAETRTQQQISRDIARLVTTRTRRQVEAVVRTATNHVGGIARGEVYRDNSDILDGERFLATLDAATTISCAGFDQQTFDIGRGPIPPIHYRCRSLRVPIIKAEFRRGNLGERASMDGPVSNQTTYGGFLKGQSVEFQNDVLGPRRAELFRSGKVKIGAFTDDLGRTLTLDELVLREGVTL